MYSLKTDTNKKPPKATTITTKVNSREKIKKKIGRSVQEGKYSNNRSFRKRHLRKWIGENS